MLQLIYPFRVSLRFHRFYSSNLFRNIGIIAHVDAGKTSTTEKLILASGLIRRSGSVDSGDTVMDYLPEERERGITINSAAITIPWRGHQINIIDTPGHVDFTVEVERSLRVLDGVVVILDYTKGIQAQTMTVWRQAERYNLPKIIFLNKIDKGGPNQKCLNEIERQFGMKPILLNKPVFLDGRIQSLDEAPINENQEIIETLCEYDQELLEKFIQDEKVSLEDIYASLRRHNNKIVPVLHGSATAGLGINSLLDSIVNILPAPPLSQNKEFAALAFKTVFDNKRNGFLNYCRIYSGELSGKRAELFNVNKGKVEASVQLMQVMADELIPLQRAETGQIVVLTGLKSTATGDTLSTSKKTEAFPGIALPTPVIGVSIEAESLSEQDRLDEALRIIQLEDPSVSVINDPETGQTILQGMGELHLEIVQKRLRNELKAKFTCGPIQIGYKEVIQVGSSLNTTLVIDKEIFGVKIVGEISVELSVEENASELQFTHYDQSVTKFVEDGVLSAFSRGPVAGFPIEKRARITVSKLNYNTPEACRTLAFEATKALLQKAAIKLHEPIVSVDLEVPSAHTGPITSDLFSARSCIDFSELDSTGDLKRIRFTAPLEKMLGYSTWLRSQTSGTGSFVMQPCGYAECLKSSNKRTLALRNLHVEQFRKILGEGILSQAAGDDLSPFLTDWTGKFKAHSSANDFIVVRPKNTTEVSEILKFCNQEKIGIVPQGGNTGLVGGATPYSEDSPHHAKVVLSLDRMNRILKIDAKSSVVHAEAGCILEKVDEECAKEANLMMPIDLGAKGSCQIGGILATNAGGIRFLRYGSLHGNTLGMEVVLADGRILNDMRALRKDNTGYDLKQIFIGSEGTLGIITAAAIGAAPRPNSVNVACFKLANFDAVQELFTRSRAALGEILSAFEFWDSQCEGALAEHQPSLFAQGETGIGFFVLIETAGSNAEHDTSKLTGFLESIMSEGLVEDGVLAQDQRQQNELWARREGIPEACSKQPLLGASQGFGQVHKFDISLPADCYYNLVPLLRSKCPKGIKVFGFGHVGDGNLHVNLVDCVGAPKAQINEIAQFIFDWTAQHGGSVSAEHGIGQAKRDVLHLSKSPVAIDLMRSFKRLLDPNGILNPGKVL